MPKQQIVRVFDDIDPGEDGTLTFHDDVNSDERPMGTVTLEELAEMCDADAESKNRHGFVMSHRLLAALLHQRLGRAQATALVLEIAEYGGLHGMNGQGDDPAGAFADVGVPDGWVDWSLA